MSQRLIWILWPGFIMAIPAIGLTFSVFDPNDMQFFGAPAELSHLAAYTLAFFFYWVVGAASSALTCMLQKSPYEINRCPLPQTDRPVGCPKRGEAGHCT
jgi:hypothetical protein